MPKSNNQTQFRGRALCYSGVLFSILLLSFLLTVVQDQTVVAHPIVRANSKGKPTPTSPQPIVVSPFIQISGNAKPTVTGLTPNQIRHAYGFDQITNQGEGQMIGIVVAFDHPNIESDLAIFNQTFSLPPCTTSNGCFQKIYASVQPGVNPEWAVDTALAVEWAHAIAPRARILLVETTAGQDGIPDTLDLLPGVDRAVQRGADVISMSWGAPEGSSQLSLDNHFVAANVTFVAASGDTGNPGLWPAASPFVTGVGGTRLHLNSQGDYIGENAAQDGFGTGGGLSLFETEPDYQAQFDIPNNPLGKRGVPDVAYNADVDSAVAVYNSVPSSFGAGWIEVGGTSAGAPQWAALFAIVNSMRKDAHKKLLTGANPALYRAATGSSYALNYNDITSGNNTNGGGCGPLCTASPGYDYVTGLGSPRANNLINALVSD